MSRFNGPRTPLCAVLGKGPCGRSDEGEQHQEGGSPWTTQFDRDWALIEASLSLTGVW